VLAAGISALGGSSRLSKPTLYYCNEGA
jgi:hypothetical protein